MTTVTPWIESRKNNYGEGPYVDDFEPGPAALLRPFCAVSPFHPSTKIYISVFHWPRAAWNVIEAIPYADALPEKILPLRELGDTDVK